MNGILNDLKKLNFYPTDPLTWDVFCDFCEEIGAKFYDKNGKIINPRTYRK